MTSLARPFTDQPRFDSTTVSPTANKLLRANSLGDFASNSALQDDGTAVGVGCAPGADALKVNGAADAVSGYKTNGAAGLSATVALAKLTAGGADGSLTFSGGLLTAYTAPT